MSTEDVYTPDEKPKEEVSWKALESIENQIEAISRGEQEMPGLRDLSFMAETVRSVRKNLEQLTASEILPEKNKEMSLTKLANENLLSQLEKENREKDAMTMTLNDILNRFYQVWNEAFIFLTEDRELRWKQQEEFHVNIIRISARFAAFVIQPQRMMYIGIGFFLLSLVLYFILVSG